MKKNILLVLKFLLFITHIFAKPTCPKTVGTELVTNGNFEAGNTGFTSGFKYIPDPANFSQDNYTIATNPKPLNSGYFKDMGDHTSGSGKMLVIDFNDNSKGDPVVTFTNVPVNASQSYFFSAWFANIAVNNTSACSTCPSPYTVKITNSPILKFQILKSSDGSVLKEATVNVDSLTNNWNQYSTSFTANFTGGVDIKIINLRGGAGSNDLALDDISFIAGCSGISDLSTLGKTSTLLKTVYTCNENFPYTLNTGLDNAKYAFDWYNGNSLTGTAGILQTDQKTTSSSATLAINTAPTNGTKYYVCYDSLGDKLTCPRLDSVVFNASFNFSLGVDRIVCPPVSEILNPNLTTTAITGYSYQKILPSTSVVSSGTTGPVPALTVTESGTYRLTVNHTNSSCGTVFDDIKIDTVKANFNGTISASCNVSNVASGTVNLIPNTSGTTSVTIINGLANVSWYNARTGGTLISGPTTTATGVSTTTAANLVKTPNCTTGGLYLQDNNSYPSNLALTEPSATINEINGYVYEKITLTAPVTISSFEVYTKSYNNSSGEDLTITSELFPSTVNFNSPGTSIATVATQNIVGLTSSNSTKVTVQGNGYFIPAGTYYLRTGIFQTNTTNTRPLGLVGSRSASSSYTDANGIITIGPEVNSYGNTSTSQHGYIINLKTQVGNTSSCGRIWVCATCTLPLDFLYVYITNNNFLVWGIQKEEIESFNIQKSIDGINFEDFEAIQASNDIEFSYYLPNSESHTYYRIKAIDKSGKISFSKTVKRSSEFGSDVSISPNPVEKGNVINITSHKELTLIQLFHSDGSILNTISDINKNNISVQTSELKSGVYFVKLFSNEHTETLKLLVK